MQRRLFSVCVCVLVLPSQTLGSPFFSGVGEDEGDGGRGGLCKREKKKKQW